MKRRIVRTVDDLDALEGKITEAAISCARTSKRYASYPAKHRFVFFLSPVDAAPTADSQVRIIRLDHTLLTDLGRAIDGRS